MPGLTTLYEAAKIGGEVLAEVAPKTAANLVELLRPAANLVNDARLAITNPGTGQTLEAVVSAGKDDTHCWSFLLNSAKKQIASMGYSLGPAAGETDSLFMYGNPPLWKPHIYLDYMNIAPEFRGLGVKEALVGELKDHSQVLGLNGRVKLLAINDEGTVSAIPWYKAGFRPQPADGIGGDRFYRLSGLLADVVNSKMQIPLEKGKIFDSMLMYLPEK